MNSLPHSRMETRQGFLFALAAYGSWGIVPAYWKLLVEMPPGEVLAYRVVYTLVLVLLIIGLNQRWGEVLGLLANRRTLLTLLASTVCIGANWLAFIQAVDDGNVLDASMGYFLNPLVNVALGVLVLKERLRPLQWAAVATAAAGVVHLSLSVGSPPWIALFLAVTFSLYGLIRKRLPVSPLIGLTVETIMMLPLAVVYLTWRLGNGASAMGGEWGLAAALAVSGPVTALPLICFAAAARRLRYSTLGFFQYLAPTGHFLLAVLVYNEVADTARLLAFAGIWMAIVLYSADGLIFTKRKEN